jgi:fatty acid desaturase
MCTGFNQVFCMATNDGGWRETMPVLSKRESQLPKTQGKPPKPRFTSTPHRALTEPMTDHITALARIPKSAMASLTDTSGREGLWHLAGHLGLIAASSGLIIAQVPFWGLLLPVQGVLLVFLFALQHETTHQTPFADTRLNEWVGRLCGVVLLVPFTWFRYFHLAHHRHTNDPERDPELASGPKPQDRRGYLLHVSGLPYWKAITRQLTINARGKADASYLPKTALPRIKAEARWMLTLYALALASLLVSPLALWLWIVPLLIGQPVLRLYLLAEHDRCAYVSNMLQNTRTTYTNRVIRYLAWNMPYHAEHHAAPQVPFYKLPALNAHLQDLLEETSNGYAPYTHAHIKSLRP